jgi:hypothetical protein
MARIRSLVAVLGAPALVVLFLAPAGAATSALGANSDAVAKAVTWLKTQQLADGGFEVAGSPGFETPDATLAIATAAQTGSTWNRAEALAAVQGITKNGKSALDALDAFADGGIDAGKAAKLILLVVEPLGLDPHHFDPAGNGGSGTDLVSILGSPAAGGSFGAFNATLYAALAHRLLNGAVPLSTAALVRDSQQPNGGWGFAGDKTASDVDADTTALAIAALVASGASASDAALQRALTMLATNQNTDGSWTTFGAHDPNSTALGAIAVATAGYDPTTSCWRNKFAPSRAAAAYASPDAFLLSQQASEGRVKSPNDSFGVNTFPTSQAVEGWARAWMLGVHLASQPCVQPVVSPLVQTNPPAPAVTANGAAVEPDSGETPVGHLPNTGADAPMVMTVVAAASFGTGALAQLGARRRRRA